MPRSVDLLSPVGPRKTGQSTPCLRVPRSGGSSPAASLAGVCFAGVDFAGVDFAGTFGAWEDACAQHNAEISRLATTSEPRCDIGSLQESTGDYTIPSRLGRSSARVILYSGFVR